MDSLTQPGAERNAADEAWLLYVLDREKHRCSWSPPLVYLDSDLAAGFLPGDLGWEGDKLVYWPSSAGEVHA